VSHFVPATHVGRRFSFSFMPHYRNASETWRRACERIGFGYIDPRSPLQDVLNAVQATEVLLAEAMHGAIIADTLRVPWIPIRSRDKILRLKWEDWCASMELGYEPKRTVELREGTALTDRMRTAAKSVVATAQLLACARRTPCLSKDEVFTRKRSQYDQRLERFRRDVRAGKFAPRVSAGA
jgi:succinoglycan biosynthesis protein ExoV